MKQQSISLSRKSPNKRKLMKDAKMREIRQFRVIIGRHYRKTFLKIEVCENISLDDYTHPHLTVVRIGDIQSISLYTPPYVVQPELHSTV